MSASVSRAALLAGYWLGKLDDDLSWQTFVKHTPTLWLGFGSLLMLGSLAFCLSRGGLVALFLGVAVAVVVHWAFTERRSWQGPIWAAIVLLAFGLLAWYGFPRMEARLATLRHDTTQDLRWSVWTNALRISRDYPLVGSGYGTFGYVEPGYRSPGEEPRVFYDFAHNDYLEAAAEGGLPRLLISVAAVVVVFVLGVRAYRRYRNHPAGAWVLGGLAAFTAVAVHSFFDFGLHIPAVTLLTTVLVAHLAALGARRTPDNRQEEYTVRLLGLAPLLGAGRWFVAGVLASQEWRLSQAERFRLAAQFRDINRKEDSHEPQVAYLETAVRYAPGDAELRRALAEAHLWQAESIGEPAHRNAAARELLIARQLCPLMRQPYKELAALTKEFTSSDPPPAYLRRAALLGADRSLPLVSAAPRNSTTTTKTRRGNAGGVRWSCPIGIYSRSCNGSVTRPMPRRWRIAYCRIIRRCWPRPRKCCIQTQKTPRRGSHYCKRHWLCFVNGTEAAPSTCTCAANYRINLATRTRPLSPIDWPWHATGPRLNGITNWRICITAPTNWSSATRTTNRVARETAP